MRILGIDPGTARMGYGIVVSQAKKGKGPKSLSSVSYGCLETRKEMPSGERLLTLEKGLLQLIKKYKPEVLAVETLFFFKNNKTVMAVSEARGIVLLVAAKQKLPVYEYSPLQIKMVIAGYGRADKKQVQRMIAQTLNLSAVPKPDDAADALGVAVTCSIALSKHSMQLKRANI